MAGADRELTAHEQIELIERRLDDIAADLRRLRLHIAAGNVPTLVTEGVIARMDDAEFDRFWHAFGITVRMASRDHPR